MKILVAEDDPVQRLLFERSLTSWGYDVELCEDGEEAWRSIEKAVPPLMVLDWIMPGMDGVEICRRLREKDTDPFYIILVTAKGRIDDIVKGLRSGADDYILKPFHPEEFRARVRNGVRMIDLQRSLSERIHELERAMNRVKQLQTLLPICSYCKRVRTDENYWTQVEAYFVEHADVQFTHGICPSCYTKIVEPELDRYECECKCESGETDELPAVQGGHR